jgi:hypothetical protein
LLLIATSFAVTLLNFRILIFAVSALGIAVVALTVGWRAIGIVVLIGMGLLCVAYLVAFFFFLPLASPPPYLSIHYSGQIDASGRTATLIEKVVVDQQFQSNLAMEVGLTNAHSLKMPDGWLPSTRLDGSQVYVRTTSLPEFSRNRWGAKKVTIPIAIGAASVTQYPTIPLRAAPMELAIVPSNGSIVTIRAPKGAIGRSDPALENVTDLPGHPVLQISSLKISPDSDAIVVDVLGAALRNPLGQKFYEFSSWGYVPWILSSLVLACVTLAGEIIRERIRATFVRDKDGGDDVRQDRRAQATASPGGRQRGEEESKAETLQKSSKRSANKKKAAGAEIAESPGREQRGRATKGGRKEHPGRRQRSEGAEHRYDQG